MKKTINAQLVRILVAFVLAVVLSYLFPSSLAKGNAYTEVSSPEINNMVNQKIIGVSLQMNEIKRIYYKEEMLGVLLNGTDVDELISKAYSQLYEKDYSGLALKFDEDIHVVEDKTFLIYENKDDAILNYLYENDMFVIDCVRINIDDDKVIYVKNKQLFEDTLRNYVLNFIDQETFDKLARNEEIPKLQSYGFQDVSVYLENKIQSTPDEASVSQILITEQEVNEYLCYGLNPEYKYYTVEEFDTIEGVGAKNGLTAEQVVAINPTLSDVNQAIAEGMQLNVRYFDSPIDVVVEQERLEKEVIYQPKALYVTDFELLPGQVEKVVEGSDGYRDTTYTDIYVDGILSGYRMENTKVVVDAVQTVYHIGPRINTDSEFNPGSELNFRLPVDNGRILCKYGCYKGHTGTDFVDRYHRWGIVHACEYGKIITNSYNKNIGWYYRIDHGSGFIFRYGHMKNRGWFEVGTVVERGQAIGDIGMTGAATAPHVHVAVIYKGETIDPCTVLPCP